MKVRSIEVKSSVAFAAALSLLLLVSQPNAYAVTSPYIGGYPNSGTNTITPFVQIYGYNDFKQSTPSSMTSDLLSMISTSGWNTNNNDATGYIYQGVVKLNNDDKVYADAQVWYAGSSPWNCFQSNTCPVLGSGTGMDYAYQTFYWDSARTKVTFYTEYHPTSGLTTYKIQTYNKQSSDTSNAFAAGYAFRQAYVGGQWTDAYFKLLQFGVESDTDTLYWKTKQYNMVYYPTSGGTVSLANKAVYELVGGTDIFDGSFITWRYDSGGNRIAGWVASNPYSVKGDYYNNNSSIPKGTIYWYPGSPPIPDGSRLW